MTNFKDIFMTITPIGFDQTVRLSPEEMLNHQIKEDGYSDLPCYNDSIFAIVSIDRPKMINIVTRVLKAELDIPLGVPVQLTRQKVIALKIKGDGTSDCPDLYCYKFRAIPSSDYETYEVTKERIQGINL
jgi:hypothetical protein